MGLFGLVGSIGLALFCWACLGLLGWVGFVLVALFSDGRVLDLAGSRPSWLEGFRDSWAILIQPAQLQIR